MILKALTSGRTLDFSGAKPIAAGGEARIYPVPGAAGEVAKVYLNPGPGQEAKLVEMLRNPLAPDVGAPGHATVCWPAEILHDRSGRFAGFLMPKVSGGLEFLVVTNPKLRQRKCPGFGYRYLLRTARTVAAVFEELHRRGYVVGDINERNMLVRATAVPVLIDVDSFQVRGRDGKIYRCGVGMPEFVPPELQGVPLASIDRLPEHDLFGLGVLVFKLLMEGGHPFDGTNPNASELSERIRLGEFPYGTCSPSARPPSWPNLEIVGGELRRLFLRCFDDGHANPSRRPSAAEWHSALAATEGTLRQCRIPSHAYIGALKSCPWCERKRSAGSDPFPDMRSARQPRPAAPVTTAAAPAASSAAAPAVRVQPKRVPVALLIRSGAALLVVAWLWKKSYLLPHFGGIPSAVPTAATTLPALSAGQTPPSVSTAATKAERAAQSRRRRRRTSLPGFAAAPRKARRAGVHVAGHRRWGIARTRRKHYDDEPPLHGLDNSSDDSDRGPAVNPEPPLHGGDGEP